MSEDIPENVVALAEDYLGCLEKEVDIENEQEVEEGVEYWKEQVDEFEEGTAMYEMAVEELGEWHNKQETIETKGETQETLKNELLSRASTEFAPQKEWLDETTIEALTHILAGQRREELLVGKFKLPAETDKISKRDMVDVAKTVHALASDAIENDERIREVWDKLGTDTRLSILRVLAVHEQPISSAEISDALGEDGTDNPGAVIRRVRGEVDIDPFYSTDDGYTFSLVGRYLWLNYGKGEHEFEGESEDGKTISEEAGQKSVSEIEEEELITDRDGDDKSDGDMDLSSFEVRE